MLKYDYGWNGVNGSTAAIAFGAGRFPGAALIALLLGACLRSAAPPAVRPTSTSVTEQEVELARATGERVRKDMAGGFVVYPAFLSRTGYGSAVDTIDSAGAARMKALLGAFRDGARAKFADTTKYRPGAFATQLPETERFYFTLTGIITVSADTATVDVFGAKPLPDGPQPESAEIEVLRYTFRAQDGRWVFVRRSIVYAT